MQNLTSIMMAKGQRLGLRLCLVAARSIFIISTRSMGQLLADRFYICLLGSIFLDYKCQ